MPPLIRCWSLPVNCGERPLIGRWPGEWSPSARDWCDKPLMGRGKTEGAGSGSGSSPPGGSRRLADVPAVRLDGPLVDPAPLRPQEQRLVRVRPRHQRQRGLGVAASLPIGFSFSVSGFPPPGGGGCHLRRQYPICWFCAWYCPRQAGVRLCPPPVPVSAGEQSDCAAFPRTMLTYRRSVTSLTPHPGAIHTVCSQRVPTCCCGW